MHLFDSRHPPWITDSAPAAFEATDLRPRPLRRLSVCFPAPFAYRPHLVRSSARLSLAFSSPLRHGFRGIPLRLSRNLCPFWRYSNKCVAVAPIILAKPALKEMAFFTSLYDCSPSAQPEASTLLCVQVLTPGYDSTSLSAYYYLRGH